MSGCPAFLKPPRCLPVSTSPRSRSRCCRQCTTIWAACRRTCTPKFAPDADNPDAMVPGLMAVGEGACVSVHGANRLGCNSLLDIVVFGRAAATRAAATIQPDASQPPLPPKAGEASLDRFDRARHAKGGTRVADLRLEMQRTMQAHAAVFRNSKTLERGRREDAAGLATAWTTCRWPTAA